jgi:DNA transposition AAA+ family ATPase
MDDQFKHDEALRSRLEHYIDKQDITHGHMAAAKLKLSSTTRLTKYLNLDKNPDRPEKDMPMVEAAVRHFFRHEDRNECLAKSLFKTSVSDDVGAVLRQIRRTGDIGLIYGPAGIGKSCGGALFRTEFSDVSMMTATFWKQGPRDVEVMLFDSLADDPAALAKPWPGNVKKATWMEELFRGSERMIIVDTAQRLHITAFKWLFDFHDVTGCSIALLGNPEVVDLLRPNDQLFSRIGIARAVKLGTDSEAIAKRMIEQYAPGSNGELLDLSVDVLTKPGHGRTLRKQLSLANDIKSAKIDWEDAFNAAGRQLVKPAKKAA